ncbi:MAG: transglutaminase-like domain-containing protein [candidate division Zixibacteria bacterium]|nr:transglutaminase-like domain-containing protein [candidate division Zixibacteria bacterium]
MFKNRLLLSIMIILTAIGAYAADPPAKTTYPPDIIAALDSAGTNRGELEKVLAHYAASGDTLKFMAAYFLIGNMEGHSYVTYSLKDTTDNVVPFDPLVYPTYEGLTASFDTLEKKYGVLDYKKKDVNDDLRTITADLLIMHIDYAFRAWKEKPWAKHLTFDQFCQYVLPYRGSNEPLENWRPVFWDKYASLESTMTDPIEAARLINKDIMTWFGFDPRYYFHPTDQGMTEMMAKGKGRCEDMTNLTIFAMRANGLAVTSDYTPAWADAGNNHAWNAILVPGGKVVPFMGAEANPGDYHLANKFAKVYRKMYGKNPDNLAFQQHKQEKLPGWLAGKNYIDVTADYDRVCNVTVTLTQAVPDSVDIAYICVFNSGEWQPIQWGRITGQTVTFAAMRPDIAYLPALYLNEKTAPAGPAFILRDDCSQSAYIADDAKASSMRLVATTKRQLEASTDGSVDAFLTPGTEYELFFWRDGWQTAGKYQADDKGAVQFENVPEGGLYWLVAKDSDREERIFTLDTGKQIWW